MSDDYAVYLAGPMNHVDDHGRTWRQELVESESGFEFLNPLDLNEKYGFEDGEGVPEWIVDEDIEMVEAADAVLAYLPFDVPSRGTAVEIWEAGKDPDTHVVIWTDVPAHAFSPFVRKPADDYAGSLDGALHRIAKHARESERRGR